MPIGIQQLLTFFVGAYFIIPLIAAIVIPSKSINSETLTYSIDKDIISEIKGLTEEEFEKIYNTNHNQIKCGKKCFIL